MYLNQRKPRRQDAIGRVLVLVVLIIAGLYIVREQVTGAGWTRPFDPTPTPTRSAESFFEEAEALYAEGLLDQAIVAYREAFAIDPEDNVALFRLVRLMVIRGQSGRALEAYGQRLQDETLGDARTLTALCKALDWHALFNSEEMLSTYVALEVIKQDEVQAEDWVYDPEKVTRQLFQAAQKVCERAVRADRELPEAHAYLAEVLADRERYEEAQASAQRGIDLNPNILDTHRAMAYVFETQGEYARAIEYYQAAIQVNDKLDFLHVALGKNYRAIGYRLQLYGEWDKAQPYFEQAVAAFEQAIALDPKNPSSYDEIGWTYGHYMAQDREMMRKGIDYLEEALAQDPDYALAYRHIGQIYYYGMHNYEEAIPNLERAIELGNIPLVDQAICHIMLGWSYYTLELREQGREQACVNANPHFEAAMETLLKLPRRELGWEDLATQGMNACQ